MHNDRNSPPHLGFDGHSTRRNLFVSSCYKGALKYYESYLETSTLLTSTPRIKTSMDRLLHATFSQCYEEAAHSLFDNDSGYISQQTVEFASFEGSSENIAMATTDVQNVYLSEDALLEKPLPASDSVIESSLTSEKSFASESDQSGTSTVSSIVPIIEPIVLKIDCENCTCGNQSLSEESCSKNCSFDCSNVSTCVRVATSFISTNKDDHANCDNATDPNTSCTNRNFDNVVISNSVEEEKDSLGQTKNSFTLLENFTDTSQYVPLNNYSENSLLYQEEASTSSFGYDSSIRKEKVALSSPSKTPEKSHIKQANPNISPDLFSDEETAEPVTKKRLPTVKICEMYIKEEDKVLLKKVQESLGGLLPPPSVTIMQMTANEILQKIEDNKQIFLTDSTAVISSQRKSLLVTNTGREAQETKWPEILTKRHHGLLFNRSKLTEDFEHLCLKYAERYIGAETQSTCTVFSTDVTSPSKRRFAKLKRTLKSPGKRLSHLARRRITFTRDSLHSSGSNLFIGARTRQILVDARKHEAIPKRRSPWKKSPRKTPSKSPRKKIKTPSSSAKKRFALRLKMYNISAADAKEASTSKVNCVKRALFDPTRSIFENSDSNSSTSTIRSDKSKQSPTRVTPRRVLFPVKPSPSTSSLYPSQRQTPVRALFTSKESPKAGKRKRTDSDNISQNSSFDSSAKENIPLPRSQSTGQLGNAQEISEHRKKKLVWAVAEALRTQNVGLDHPQFKTYASVLARVTRRSLPNLFTHTVIRTEGSTSESMLRIARQHVFAVTRGKTVDEIMNEQQSKQKVSKPLGYIGPNQSGSSKEGPSQSKNVLQDKLNTLDGDKAKSRLDRDQKIQRIRRAINFDNQDDPLNVGGIR